MRPVAEGLENRRVFVAADVAYNFKSMFGIPGLLNYRCSY